MTRRISDAEAREIRRAPRGSSAGCGEVALVVGSGRATCRHCGRKIVKGEPALATVYDFYGGGLAGDPWTGVEIQIHAKCPCHTGQA